MYIYNIVLYILNIRCIYIYICINVAFSKHLNLYTAELQFNEMSWKPSIQISFKRNAKTYSNIVILFLFVREGEWACRLSCVGLHHACISLHHCCLPLVLCCCFCSVHAAHQLHDACPCSTLVCQIIPHIKLYHILAVWTLMFWVLIHCVVFLRRCSL